MRRTPVLVSLTAAGLVALLGRFHCVPQGEGLRDLAPAAPLSVPAVPGAPTSAPVPACGIERWDVKIGSDPLAPPLGGAAAPSSIEALRALRPAGPVELHTPRFPEERVVRELRDVRLVCVKHEREGDRDYHLVIEERADPVVEPSEDHGCRNLHDPPPSRRTMIVEVPDPACVPQGQLRDAIARVRDTVDREAHPQDRARRVNRIVTLRGVTFFDVVHGQLGVAPNGIELHPVVAMCFGQGCAP